ncbi:MAG: hypothetical protein IPK88_07550 [Saprospiraceae bacterium]|nr:hypothetical protein [Candidatus Defluviibacterium haderslevense]
MSKNKNKAKFDIPNPLAAVNNLDISKKYVFGEAANRLHDIKQHKPVFAFDFISLDNSDYCFNSNLINTKKDYNRLFHSFKSISNKSYLELSTENSFHFHEVEFKDTKISQSDFLKCLVLDPSKINPDHCPTVYQFKTFEEARVFGFVAKMIFYLVFFDRNHRVYKRK